MATDHYGRSHHYRQRVGPPIEDIEGIDQLISRMRDCDDVQDWGRLLKDYVNWGTYFGKVASSVAIFNMGAAHDCPNRWTDHCQVDGDDCYAVHTERRMPYTLEFYRRQEYLWDSLDADTFAAALQWIIRGKQLDPVALKFNMTGDFRHDGDVVKANRVAEQITLDVFCYSASDYLDWSKAPAITVNQSNSKSDYGVRRYQVVETPADVPDDGIHCPYDLQKHRGVNQKSRINCGECRACIDRKAGDIYVARTSG